MITGTKTDYKGWLTNYRYEVDSSSDIIICKDYLGANVRMGKIELWNLPAKPVYIGITSRTSLNNVVFMLEINGDRLYEFYTFSGTSSGRWMEFRFSHNQSLMSFTKELIRIPVAHTGNQYLAQVFCQP